MAPVELISTKHTCRFVTSASVGKSVGSGVYSPEGRWLGQFLISARQLVAVASKCHSYVTPRTDTESQPGPRPPVLLGSPQLGLSIPFPT